MVYVSMFCGGCESEVVLDLRECCILRTQFIGSCVVTVLILQPSVHELATPFSIHSNLCVPLPLHNCQIYLLLVLYCIVFYFLTVNVNVYYVNVNYGCEMKRHRYLWTCIPLIKGGESLLFPFFSFARGGSYNFCEGRRNLCNVGFFCAIYFLKLFSKFHPGLVSDRFKKSLHSKKSLSG